MFTALLEVYESPYYMMKILTELTYSLGGMNCSAKLHAVGTFKEKKTRILLWAR